MMKEKSNLSIGLGGVVLIATALYTVGRLVTGIHSFLGGNSPFAHFPIYVDFALGASLWLVWMEAKRENNAMEKKLQEEKIAREGVLEVARDLIEEASNALSITMEKMHISIKDEYKDALAGHMREITRMYEANTKGIEEVKKGLDFIRNGFVSKGLLK